MKSYEIPGHLLSLNQRNSQEVHVVDVLQHLIYYITKMLRVYTTLHETGQNKDL